MSRILSLFWIVSIFVALPRASCAAPMYSVSNDDLKLEIKNDKWKKGDYRLTITRQFANDQQNRMLKKAEALYLDRKRVLHIAHIPAISDEAQRKHDAKLQKRFERIKNVWWRDSVDGVRIAYSITTSAVLYYRDLIEGFRKNTGKGANVKMLGAQLEYFAAIKHHDKLTINRQTFKNVNVAYMELKWSQYCGDLCAMHFSKKRKVIFDSGAKLIVFGDGNPGVGVS